MKTCSKCKIEKEFSEFYECKRVKSGYRSACKSCGIEYVKENKERILEYGSSYRKNNKDKLKKWFKENEELLKQKKKEYRDNPDKKEKQKEWWKNNKEKKKEYRKKYSKSESCKEHRKNWYLSLKDRKPYVLAWRSILTNALKRFSSKKIDKTINLLGYSALELKTHIESLFLEGMTWENYGEWHIDHIKMVSTFDKETTMNIVNSLDNLRPLWAKDNCSRKLNN